MLDITGSMCDSAPDLDDAPCTKGVKLDGMKTAASNLVKSMLATDELKTRVALLQAEITRLESEISSKDSGRQAAEDLFRSR